MAPPVRTSLLALCVTLLVVWLPRAAVAQDDDAEALAPPHLSLVEGAVRLERGAEVVEAEAGHILAVGDRIHSDNGRYEIVFGDGSALHVDRHTTLDLLDDWLLRLLEGRVFLHVATPPDDLPVIAYRIDTPAVSVRAAMPGEYRISAAAPPGATDVAVARGIAEVFAERGSVALRAGERVSTRAGSAPGIVSVFNAAAWDDFDRWSYARRGAWTEGAHAAYLPRQLAPYSSTLARHGTWSHHPTYGAVWYPHVVSDWRPFYHGRWTALSPYGWTWVGVDPWAWPTHYYGSWSVVSGRWFWIPGRVWAPARVHWVVAPGYVGWLPFGPVGVVHHIGWTIVPRHVFHVNVIVPRHAINVYTLRPDVRRTFVAQRPAEPVGVAVPRASVIAASRARAAAPRGEAATALTGAAAATAVRRAPAAGLQTETGRAATSRTLPGESRVETGSAAIRRTAPGGAQDPSAAVASGTRRAAPEAAPPASSATDTVPRGAPGVRTYATPRTTAGAPPARPAAPRAAAPAPGASAPEAAAPPAEAFPRTTPAAPGATARARPAPATPPALEAPASPPAGATGRAAPRSAPAPAAEPAAPAGGEDNAPAGGRAAPRGGAATPAPGRTPPAPRGSASAPATSARPGLAASSASEPAVTSMPSAARAGQAAGVRSSGGPAVRTVAPTRRVTTAPRVTTPRMAPDGRYAATPGGGVPRVTTARPAPGATRSSAPSPMAAAPAARSTGGRPAAMAPASGAPAAGPSAAPRAAARPAAPASAAPRSTGAVRAAPPAAGGATRQR